ncbi:MAG: hypothetical protein JJE27_02525 [Thermoleophilia bacterium]|nr:hypothetical protein [Thermoleophilia bacterium]
MTRVIVLAAIVAVILLVTVVARTLLHRRHAIGSIDAAHLDGAARPRTVVIFTSPFCHGCRQWIDTLTEQGVVPLALDVVARPELAARYRINVTPRVAVVNTPDGAVLGEWDHYTPRAHDVERVLRLINGH